MAELFRKNHGSGDNWTGQSTAASLIDPSDASDADGAEFFLVTKLTLLPFTSHRSLITPIL